MGEGLEGGLEVVEMMGMMLEPLVKLGPVVSQIDGCMVGMVNSWTVGHYITTLSKTILHIHIMICCEEISTTFHSFERSRRIIITILYNTRWVGLGS